MTNRFVRASKIQGNFIGADKNGETSGLQGNTGAGVLVQGGSSGNIIGDNNPNDAADASNIIAGNGGDGVVILDRDSTGHRILRNSIFSSGGLGIDLANDGPTANDPKDPDTGPNGFQNFPVLSSAKTTGSSITIRGNLNSTPGRTFTLQFFSNPSGNEGRTFLAQRSVSTNSNGNAPFAFVFTAAVPAGQTITATGSGGTSEFSGPRTVVAQYRKQQRATRAGRGPSLGSGPSHAQSSLGPGCSGAGPSSRPYSRKPRQSLPPSPKRFQAYPLGGGPEPRRTSASNVQSLTLGTTSTVLREAG